MRELHNLYTQLNALASGRERINVNEKVAQEFGVSARQIKTYMSIDKLIPELRQLFEQNSITLKMVQITRNYQRQNRERLLH